MSHQDLACNIQAISADLRPRYNDLISRLRAAIRDCRELPDGFSYSLDSEKIASPEVSEWITMERLCCPFLIFKLEGGDEASRLTMRGPDGVKAILREEFRAGGQDG